MDDHPDLPPAVPLRASNADREAVVQALHNAAADGQLSLAEMEDRLRLAYRATTVADLQPLTVDLTATPLLGPAVTPSRPIVDGAPTRIWALLSGVERTGPWQVPGHLEVAAVLGSVKLDLRHAVFEHPHIAITSYTICGGVEIIVPDDLDVFVDGAGLLGGFENRAGATIGPSRGSVRVSGFTVMSGVQVRRASKKERRKAGQLDKD